MDNNKIGVWARSCLKKSRYNSIQHAQDVINKIHKKRNVELRVYFCKECLGYHITHTKITNQK